MEGLSAHRLRLGHQRRRLRHRQFTAGRRQGLAGGLEFLLQGADPLHDLGRLGLEAIAQFAHHLLPLADPGQHRRARHRLDAADTGRHAALSHDLEEADLGGIGHMGAAAQLHRHPGHIHHPHPIAVLLTKHRHRARSTGPLDLHLLHLQRMGIGDPAVDQRLDPLQLRPAHRPGAVEIEAEPLEIHQRAGLGDRRIHHLLERRLQQVRGGVVRLHAAAAGPVHPRRDHIPHPQLTPLDAAAVHKHAAVAAHRLDHRDQSRAV